MSDFDGFRITGHRDDVLDEIELIGWTPGPAGVAELTLSGGTVSLLVDYADPSQFCALRYPVGSDAAAPLLDALSGGHPDELAAAIDALGDTPKIVWDGVGRSLELFETLTQMALLESQIETLTRPELVEIADLLAYGLAGFDLPAELEPTRRPEAAIGAAVERLETFLATEKRTVEVEAGVDGDTIDRMVDLLGALSARVEAHDATLTGRLRELSVAVADRQGEPVPDLDVIPPASAPGTMPIQQGEGRFDVEVRVAGLFEVTAHDATVHGPELSVRIGHSPDSFPRGIPEPGNGKAACWLRVYRRVQPHQHGPAVPLLIAMAPFVPRATDAMVAVALLPVDAAEAELIAEVTDRPADQWRDEPEQLIRYAVTMGQSAARLGRDGDRDTARDRWQVTSAAWSEAADERRSRLAADYADDDDDDDDDGGGGGRPLSLPRR